MSDGELIIIPDKDKTVTRGGKTNNEDVVSRYQSDIAKPMHSAGNTSISMAQAKLFGLLDADGTIKTKTLKCTSLGDVTHSLESKGKSRIFDMSNPRPPHKSQQVSKSEGTFTRTQGALNAMKNPDCGYDFVERLEEKGNFLDSLDSQAQSKRAKGRRLEAAKADYEAKLDKLACPTCKKEQTFDEFYEKKRKCSMCGDFFKKLIVCNGSNFAKRTAEMARIREEKLKKKENDIYGNDGKPYIPTRFKPKEKMPKQSVIGKLIAGNRQQAVVEKQIIRKQQQELSLSSKAKQANML